MGVVLDNLEGPVLGKAVKAMGYCGQVFIELDATAGGTPKILPYRCGGGDGYIRENSLCCV